MKSKKRKILLVCALAAAVLCAALAVFGAFGGFFGGLGGGSGYGGNGVITASAAENNVFTYDKVHIDITVNQDKTMNVTETLVARWKASYKRSLIRDIQRQSRTTRYIDGKKIKGQNYFAKMTDVSATIDGNECDWQIIGKKDDAYLDGFYSVEMMLADGSYLETNTPYTFVLSYKYDMGDDRLAKFDDLTYDIFGYEMNMAEEFSAKVTFPEGVAPNAGDVTLRTGSVSLPSAMQRLVVSGSVVEILAMPRERGLTLQVILPKGTFTGGVTIFWYYWIFAVLAVVAVAAVIVLFIMNLPKKPVETVEFYPPEGVSVMEFSAIWHRTVKSKDAAALILKWADMGLITIEKEAGQHLVLRLVKPAEDAEGNIPEDNKYFDCYAERVYFETLFSGIGGSRTVFSTKAFKASGPSNQHRLYDATEKLVESVKDYKVVKPAKKVRVLISALGLVPMLMALIYSSIICSTFLPLFFFVFMAAGMFVGSTFFNAGPSLPTALILIFPVMFFAMPYMAYLLAFAMPLYDYARLVYVAPAIYAVCEFLLPIFVGRRTEEANKTYGRILGFKRFLLTAELSRISLLFDENPDYFSDILPWCMIMGISDKVQKRFAMLKSINMPKVVEDNIDVRWVSRSVYYSSRMGAPRSSGGGFSGGGGGGRGGSSGGGGGGGGSRSR